jgi:hypothetical protein
LKYRGDAASITKANSMSQIRHVPQTGENAFISLERRWVRAAGAWGGAALLAASLLAPVGLLAAADGPAGRDGLVLEYRLDKDEKDSSGQGLHGMLHGNPRFATVDGRAGLVFDGTGDWVEADLKLPEPCNEVTFECWVRPAAQQVPYADIFGYHTHAGVGFVLQQDGSNTNSYVFTYSNSAGGWISTKPVRLAADRWQHVAIAKSPKDLKFHVNGVLLDSVASTLPLIAASPLSFRIGLGFDDESRCLTEPFPGFASGIGL